MKLLQKGTVLALGGLSAYFARLFWPPETFGQWVGLATFGFVASSAVLLVLFVKGRRSKGRIRGS